MSSSLGKVWVCVKTFVCAIGISTLYVFSVFEEPILDACPDWSSSTPTSAIAVMVFLSVVASIVASPRLDPYGPVPFAVLSIVTSTLGLVLSGLAVQHCFQWLYYVGLGIILGTGSGLAYFIALRHVLKHFPKKMGAAGSFFGGSLGVGSVVLTLVEAQLIQRVGPADAFYFLGGITTILLLPLLAMKFPTPPTKKLNLSPTISLAIHRRFTNASSASFNSVSRSTTSGHPTVLLSPPQQQQQAGRSTATTISFSSSVSSQPPFPPPPPSSLPPISVAETAATAAAANLAATARPRSLWALMKIPHMWIFWFVYFSSLVAGWGLVSNFTSVFSQVCGLTWQQSAYLSAAANGAYTAGRFLVGPTSDFVNAKTGRGRQIAYFSMLLVISVMLVVLVVLPSSSTTTTTTPVSDVHCVVKSADMMVIALAFGGAKSIFSAFATELFGPADATMATGIIITGYGAAGVVGPLLIQYSLHLFFQVCLGISAFGTFLVFFLQPGVGKPKIKEGEEVLLS